MKHNDQVRVVKTQPTTSKTRPVELRVEGVTRKMVTLPDGSIRILRNGRLVEEA